MHDRDRMWGGRLSRTQTLVVWIAAWFWVGPVAGHPPPRALTHAGWVYPPLLAAPAPPRSVDPPLRLTVRDAQGERLRGAMVGFDEIGFLFEVRGDERPRRLLWTVLDPGRVYKIHERLLDRHDAEGWLRLGAALYSRDAEIGENALSRALRIDPDLADRAARARDGQPIGEPAPPSDTEPSETGADGSGAEDRGGDTPTGPVAEGETQAEFWGPLTQDVMRSSTESLLGEAQRTRHALGLDLKVYDESKYFLFVADLPGKEARRWAGLLDRLYDRLCDTFAVPRGTNIFRGRGLIYVFRRESDYHRFHRVFSGFDSRGSAGLCKSYGDGRVEITFYRQPNDTAFSHVLVHEAVHGFLHRYRSFPFVPSWANEGLAEFIAADLVGLYNPQQVRALVAENLRRAGGTGGMLNANPIAGWQYPVAQALCDFMIAQDRGRYRDFINAIKDGKSWRLALREDYGVTQERLLAAFGQALGLPDLRY